MKGQKYWILRIHHVCRVCGEYWVTKHRVNGKKPESYKDRNKYISNQYHCTNE